MAKIPDDVAWQDVDAEIIVELLRQACNEVGQRAWARNNGVSTTFVNHILNGKALPSDKIAAAFGYRRMVRFVHESLCE